MNWRSFLSGALGGLLIVATLSFPQIRAQTPWVAYPTNVVFMFVSGSCPVSTQEVASLDGVMPYGTLSAHGDVGTMGGSDTVTPAGTNGTVSFTPAGTIGALTTGADSSTTGGVAKAIAQTPTFTGSALGTHTHTVPAEVFTGSAGTVPAEVISWPAGVPTNATSTIPAETFTGSAVTSGAGSSHLHAAGTLAASTPTIAWPAGVPTNATSTIPAETFTGSALGTHTHTLTATGTNGTVSFTPSGTNSTPAFTGNAGTVPAETWTGNSLDNRSAFVKVIFCQKT